MVIIINDCQLVHGMKRGGFALLMDKNRILKMILKSLIVVMTEDIITPV